MIDIQVCPSTLAVGYGAYSPKAIKNLFGGIRVSPLLDFGIDEFRMTEDIVRAVNRISVSGAQEKFPAVIENGKIRLAADNEKATYILKPAPWDETIATRKQIPVNENLTMQIASQVYGIRTAANGLCFSPSGEAIYITKRFDIAEDGSRYGMEDFNTSVHIDGDDFGLNRGLSSSMEKSDVYDRTGHPCRTDFERFGRIVGLKEKRMKALLDTFSVLPQQSSALIGNSYLNDKMKRSYLRTVNTRLSRFNRQSD